MSEGEVSRRTWMAAIVVLHLALSIVHGGIHDGAHVPLSRAASLFVFIVILGGPLVGLSLLWRFERTGSWLIGGTMAASRRSAQAGYGVELSTTGAGAET